MSTRLIAAVFVAFAVVASPVTVTAAQQARTPEMSSDPAAVKSRLENVRRLVTSSSGARRIIESGDPHAQALRNEAEFHVREAEKAFGIGDMTATQSSLQSATDDIFAAVRKIGTGQDGIDKQNRDFAQKAASVDVLLKAVERVATEKGGDTEVVSRARQTRKQLNRAKELADSGRLEEARKALDEVYQSAKVDLERLREGETLVRSLVFDSPEQEYHYEIDRYDTHMMLLKVLLTDREKSAGMQRLIDSYKARAAELRLRAQSEADGGGFKKGIQTLEEATRYLQRAIRSAGVYIPG